MSGKRVTAEAIDDNRQKNLAYSRRERDRLAKQRKAAAERQMGIRRCRRGHRLDVLDGYCKRCRVSGPRISESELVTRILALDAERELAPSCEWPQFRQRIAVLRDQIDEMARKRQWSYGRITEGRKAVRRKP